MKKIVTLLLAALFSFAVAGISSAAETKNVSDKKVEVSTEKKEDKTTKKTKKKKSDKKTEKKDEKKVEKKDKSAK